MIQFKLKQLIAQREFAERRHIMVKEICEQTGLHRSTLNRMLNHKPHNIGCEVIDLLCEYFGCSVSELMDYVPERKPVVPASDRGVQKDRRPRKGANKAQAKAKPKSSRIEK